MSEHVFITGGTELVGYYLISCLLPLLPGSTMTLLVRNTRERTAHERVADLGMRFRDSHGLDGAPRRLHALPGDVARRDLGLHARARRELQDRTMWIVHGAATIRFDHPLAHARATNTGGTRAQALRLHRDLICVGRPGGNRAGGQAGTRSAVFQHVRTIHVRGRTPGPRPR